MSDRTRRDVLKRSGIALVGTTGLLSTTAGATDGRSAERLPIPCNPFGSIEFEESDYEYVDVPDGQLTTNLFVDFTTHDPSGINPFEPHQSDVEFARGTNAWLLGDVDYEYATYSIEIDWAGDVTDADTAEIPGSEYFVDLDQPDALVITKEEHDPDSGEFASFDGETVIFDHGLFDVNLHHITITQTLTVEYDGGTATAESVVSEPVNTC